jgi:DNA mismatch repair protein MutS
MDESTAPAPYVVSETRAGSRFDALQPAPESSSESPRRPRAVDAKTPLLKQYLTLKEAHPNEVLFFRCGDFYEMFYDDAETVSKALGLVLTTRGPGQESCPMAGIPYHAVDRYLPRLIRMGFRVAICEQMEDPKTVQGKRIVERSVVEVITPGTLTDEKLLEEKEPCWLCSVHRPQRGPIGLAWLDISTGHFCVSDVRRDSQALEDELARVRPREILVVEAVLRALSDPKAGGGESVESDLGLARVIQRAAPSAAMAPAPDWAFDAETALAFMKDKLGVATLAGFDIEDRAPCVSAGHAILRYAEEKKPGFLGHVREIARHRPEAHVAIDAATARCLELVETLRGRERNGSLLGSIDATRTAMGGRLLRDWILSPLRDVEAIEARQDAIEALLETKGALDSVRDGLAKVFDLERLAGRAASGRAVPRDLAALRDSLAHLPSLRDEATRACASTKKRLAPRAGGCLGEIARRLDPLDPLFERLARSLVAQPAATPSDGEIIAIGIDEGLDDLREIARDATALLARFQAKEIERTGISSLKVAYNSILGYYLEVTQAHRDKIPDDYIRKQTLKNCERFLTPELKELEGKILTARERAEGLEATLLRGLREEVARCAPSLLASARAVAELDALAGLAHVARERGYARPRVAAHGAAWIVAGKHPVLEAGSSGEPFVPNDLRLVDLGATSERGDDEGRILVITGPNMAGKSTYIRQTALLFLLAQVGSFLPAESAELGVCDRIFARVGAADDLARGLSTFMVEMTETANILRHATEKSLVVLDEVGRGTSTYDGVSIAWAIVEHLHDHVRCRALFATHYHELVGLARVRSLVANRTCAVRETRSTSEGGGQIVFLRKIVPGAADRSYGLHVARLAGVPRNVVERAQEILSGLESGSFDALHASEEPEPAHGPQPSQLALFTSMHERIASRLRAFDPDRSTPLQALLILSELKNLAEA